MKPLTALQSLYWQKESLQNMRWSLDRRIQAVVKHGKTPLKLSAKRAEIISQIQTISAKMQFIEASSSTLKVM